MTKLLFFFVFLTLWSFSYTISFSTSKATKFRKELEQGKGKVSTTKKGAAFSPTKMFFDSFAH